MAKVASVPPVMETKAHEEDTTETPTTNAKEEAGGTQDTPVANATDNIVKLLLNHLSDCGIVIKSFERHD